MLTGQEYVAARPLHERASPVDRLFARNAFARFVFVTRKTGCVSGGRFRAHCRSLARESIDLLASFLDGFSI
jgi:hypothetical protein